MCACQPAPCLYRTSRGRPALLDDESRLLALRGEHSLDHGLVVGSRLHRDDQVVGRVTDIDAPGAFPGAREERLHDTADLEVTLDRGDPATKAVRIGDGDQRSSMSVLYTSSTRTAPRCSSMRRMLPRI